MTVSIRKLVPGQKVVMNFHGSAEYGNAGYTEEGTFRGLRYDLERATLRAVGAERAIFLLGDDEEASFEVYFFRNRWRYGTSAEIFTVNKVL